MSRSPDPTAVRSVTAASIGPVLAYLEGHLDTSIFLLSCLTKFGPELCSDGRSGNYRAIEGADGVSAVWSLTRRGHLLAQTGGRTDFTAVILESCASDPVRICGVVAEWQLADALWRAVTPHAAFARTYAAKSTVYALDLAHAPASGRGGDLAVRVLTASDFGAWDALNVEFAAEEGAPIAGDLDGRRRYFEACAAGGQCWGGFEGDALVTMAALDHDYAWAAQVGGIFTRADRRGRGFARTILTRVLNDLLDRRYTRAVLFGYEREAARRLYEVVGFRATGHFGLFYGTWQKADG
jgi:predicted GNAT family acetyltransferase